MKRIVFIGLLLILFTACSAQRGAESDTAASQPNTSVQNGGGGRATPTNEGVVEAAPMQPAPTETPQPAAEPTDEPETAVVDTPTSEPELASEMLDPVSDFTVTAADETLIATTIYMPAGEGPFPGVILLHMLGGRRQDWEQVGLTDELTAAGYAVMAVDMRGHGETRGSRDWAVIEQDLVTVWQAFTNLAQVDGENTAVVGGSIGSNMALITGDNIPEIKTAILLSPGLDYRGVTTDDRIASYGERPLLIIASEEDSYSAESSRTLADLAAENTELTMLNGAGHGTNMLTQTGVRQEIIAWLDANLK